MSELHNLAENGWKIVTEKTANRQFEFRNFYKTMGFVNAVAVESKRSGIATKLAIGYGYCGVEISLDASEAEEQLPAYAQSLSTWAQVYQ